MKDSKYLSYLGLLVLLLLVFGSGWLIRDIGANSDMESVLKDHEIQLEEIEVVRTKNTTLVKALASADEDRAVLLDEIASMKSKPTEIRYITKVETVIQGSETIVVTELPGSHTFQLESGLPVAEFSVVPGVKPEYKFDTADLTIKANVVIGERDSAISLIMESDLEPGIEREVPVAEFTVQHIRKNKLVEPNILIGAGISAGATGVGAGPQIAVSFIHPKDEWDLLQIRAGSSSGKAQIGFDPALYNLGGPLPVVTNLWVGAGVSIDARGQTQATVSIGAKL